MSQLLMVHPDFPDRAPTPTSETAFKVAWEAKGWQIFDRKTQQNPIDKAAQLEDMSKSELYEIASDLDISGRSSMGIDELILAIRSTNEFFTEVSLPTSED